MLLSVLTIFQVVFTTSTVTAAGSTSCSVGLDNPTPSSALASTTPPSYSTPASPASGTTFGTSYGTSLPASASASTSPITPAPAFGAGAKTQTGFAGLLLGVVAAFAAL